MIVPKLDAAGRRIGGRHHLTDDQRACLAEEERRYLAAKSKERPSQRTGKKEEALGVAAKVHELATAFDRDIMTLSITAD